MAVRSLGVCNGTPETVTKLTETPLAFVDLETTGANSATERITEIGIVTLCDTETQEWSQLVQPELPISDFIQQLTGISNAMVADAPRFADIAREVLARLEGHVFIAHNARFDFGFLRNEFGRLGIEFRAEVVCTVKLSRALYPQHHKHSLDSLIARHNLDMASRHRALSDARAICQFWDIARREVGEEQFQAALLKIRSSSSLPPQIDPVSVDALPDGCGVFLIYGEAGKILHVGRGNPIKKRLLAQFASDRKRSDRSDSLTQLARRVEGIQTHSELGARLLETHLKSRHPQINGKHSALRTWCLRQATDAPWSADILELSDKAGALPLPLEFSPEMCHGFFRSAREARARLSELAVLNGLCPVMLGLEKTSASSGACSAFPSKKCKGACCGHESIATHHARARTTLQKLQLLAWPFEGAAIFRDGTSMHVIDRWCHLGVAQNEAGARALANSSDHRFTREAYHLLSEHSEALRSLDF